MAEIKIDRTPTLPTNQDITFQTSDHNTNVTKLDDPVVISLQLGDLLVKKVLLDPGSSADVLFYSTFQKMKLSSNILQPSTGDLVGFSGERVPVIGSVWLQTILGEDNTIATIHTDAREARECYNNNFKRPNQNNSDKFTYVGSTVSSEEKALFQAFLQQNADLFAWTPADMPGIDPSIISHKLALDPSVRPIAQKKRNLGHNLKQASLEKTKKLINTGFIQEIRFTTWLANAVMVKKHNVDNASGYQKLNFMAAYSDYNQIQMHPSDQNKTTFITEYGNYCYKVMPFGLKKAGVTYQCLMDKVFAQQIGRNIEVYIEDMVPKTKIGNNHLDDLAEIFGQIRKYNMRLNPEKCAFGIQSGKFLGFVLTSREWSLYVDGSSNPQECGAGIILDDGNDNVIEQSLHFSFKASNNQSEYEALIAGLRLASNLNIAELKVYCDSLLIVQQVNELYQIVKQKLKDVTTARNTVQSPTFQPNYYTVPRGTTLSKDRLTKNDFLCLEAYYM
ncbi:uncharacterized protein [Arachis hypogaea]|uniref:uncharacterized protein n=1 Tax=Arachis hypogaea TaxID=3818 RepID=UPI000DEC52DF|nr:uncharacterized protein LOC112742461 [Arachis hypogaea]